MQTKFKEITKTTSVLSEMRDQFLAKKLVRAWQEDFVDEDNGEVVTITRTELILECGTRIGSDELTLINFHLQSKDITEVEISNQQRAGILNERMASVWTVTVYSNKKNHTVYLYSNSIDKCQMIATDYLEQLLVGGFSFVGIKEASYAVLIPEAYREDIHGEDYYEADYYQIEVSIDIDFNRFESTFIVNAHDADDAKRIVEDFIIYEKTKLSNDSKYKTLNQNCELLESESINLTTISAKKIKCNYVVDYKFSMEYFTDND